MIQEAYVSFETAKLLKEKGFNEDCEHYYTPEGKFKRWFPNGLVSYLNNQGCETWWWKCVAPTQALTMRWLREVHKIHINTVFLGPSLKWTPTIWKIDMTIPESKHIKSTLNTWESYEDAVEAAIKYCLTNLI